VTSPSPGTVHLTGAGSCTNHGLAGDGLNYNLATNVLQSFTINKRIKRSRSTQLASKTFGDLISAANATASSVWR
jgi:hypothetical protein